MAVLREVYSSGARKHFEKAVFSTHGLFVAVSYKITSMYVIKFRVLTSLYCTCFVFPPKGMVDIYLESHDAVTKQKKAWKYSPVITAIL